MKIKALPASELTVMKIIWDVKRPVQMGEIYELAVGEYKKEWCYQTVSTYLRSLVKRGFLSMTAKGRGYDYAPLISEDEYLKSTMGELVDFWGKQSLKYVASALNANHDLFEKDIQELKKLIHEPM